MGPWRRSLWRWRVRGFGRAFPLVLALACSAGFIGALTWPWALPDLAVLQAPPGAPLQEPWQERVRGGDTGAEPGGSGLAQRREEPFACRVTRVIDGDTLACAGGERIRLHAVAAREKDETCSPGHPCPDASAAEATNALRRLALGRVLSCEATGQTYGRIAAICWDPMGTEINCAMVESGTTLVWPRFNAQRPICG